MVAGIGPSLGPCCAEFVNYTREIPRRFWHYRVSECHFDFWAITRAQLCQAGVVADNVYTSEICTRCNPQAFYSYRGQRVTGRFAAAIGLRSKASEPVREEGLSIKNK
jgi:copper oxidase (laccase) domain-containing protein